MKLMDVYGLLKDSFDRIKKFLNEHDIDIHFDYYFPSTIWNTITELEIAKGKKQFNHNGLSYTVSSVHCDTAEFLEVNIKNEYDKRIMKIEYVCGELFIQNHDERCKYPLSFMLTDINIEHHEIGCSFGDNNIIIVFRPFDYEHLEQFRIYDHDAEHILTVQQHYPTKLPIVSIVGTEFGGELSLLLIPHITSVLSSMLWF